MFALDDIPRGWVVAAVPDHLALCMTNYPAFDLAEAIGDTLPDEMKDLRERLRLAALLLMESLNDYSRHRPWLRALPDVTQVLPNAVGADEAEIRAALAHASLPPGYLAQHSRLCWRVALYVFWWRRWWCRRWFDGDGLVWSGLVWSIMGGG